jgi:putative addiction module component (TIGR02574 family)
MRKEYDFSRARRGAVIPDHKAPLVTPEQRAELDRRLAAYEIDRNRGRPAADVLADVHYRLRRER